MVGGVCALVGCKNHWVRVSESTTKTEKPEAIPGHNLPIGSAGCLYPVVLLVWFQLRFHNSRNYEPRRYCHDDKPCAAAATLLAMTVTWLRYGKPDVSMTFNGSLAGLVAITAGCDTVSNWSAIIIGAIAGIVVVFSVEFF